MDKLLTNFEGGFPLWLDDYRFFQGANEFSFEAIIKAVLNGEDAFRLHGCNVTEAGANYSISAGAIAFKGEIVKVDAHTAAKPTSAQPDSIYVWMITETNDPAGSKTFKDGTVVDTYLKRRAIYININNVPAGTSTDNLAVILHDFYSMLRTHLAIRKPTGWQAAALGSEFTQNKDKYMQFRINACNQLEIRGSALPSIRHATTIMILPAGFRPPFTVQAIARNGRYIHPIEIKANGYVTSYSGLEWPANMPLDYVDLNLTIPLDSDRVTASGTGGGGGLPTT